MEQLPKTDVRVVDQFNFEQLWAKYGSRVLTGATVVVVVFLAIVLWQRQSSEKQEAASVTVAESSDAASLENVAREFPGKEVGAQSLLRLGDIQFNSGKYSDAAGTYVRFLSEYPHHEFADAAALGQAASTESAGDLATARSLYEQLASTKPSGFLAIAARVGAARCMQGLGQTNEARQAYEELLPAVQGTTWQAEVYLRWVELSRSISSTQTRPTTNQVSAAPASPSTKIQP